LASAYDMTVPLEGHAASSLSTAQVAEGDLDALARLYEEHHERVRRFARRLVGEEAAEDLVHDTFLTLPKAMRRWNRESSLRTFIIGVALNHARHHVRAATRRRAAMQRFSAEPPERAASPADALDQRQLAELLMRALDTLSFQHRSTFVLCDVEERSAAEAGELLGIPEATVRTRLFHARKKLRAALERRGLR
jgi:RNA polymerase sigma-70 factor (ECF subfamily)